MTPELSSALRSVLLILGGIAVGKGWLDSTALDGLVSAILILIMGWGVYGKNPRSAEARAISAKVRRAR